MDGPGVARQDGPMFTTQHHVKRRMAGRAASATVRGIGGVVAIAAVAGAVSLAVSVPVAKYLEAHPPTGYPRG
jgi:hypothetical protein